MNDDLISKKQFRENLSEKHINKTLRCIKKNLITFIPNIKIQQNGCSIFHISIIDISNLLNSKINLQRNLKRNYDVDKLYQKINYLYNDDTDGKSAITLELITIAIILNSVVKKDIRHYKAFINLQQLFYNKEWIERIAISFYQEDIKELEDVVRNILYNHVNRKELLKEYPEYLSYIEDNRIDKTND